MLSEGDVLKSRHDTIFVDSARYCAIGIVCAALLAIAGVWRLLLMRVAGSLPNYLHSAVAANAIIWIASLVLSVGSMSAVFGLAAAAVSAFSDFGILRYGVQIIFTSFSHWFRRSARLFDRISGSAGLNERTAVQSYGAYGDTRLSHLVRERRTAVHLLALRRKSDARRERDAAIKKIREMRREAAQAQMSRRNEVT